MIINSLLDMDNYTFSMAQGIMNNYPDVEVEFAFKWRNHLKTFNTLSDANKRKFVINLEQEIHHLCNLKFQLDELEYLMTRSYQKDSFVSRLEGFQLKNRFIKCWIDEYGELQISGKGPWFELIWFEEPILSIISELWSNENASYTATRYISAAKILDEKIKYLKDNLHHDADYNVSEFGGRRRHSFQNHDFVISRMIEEIPQWLAGTSNVFFAKKYNIKAIGTMAHQWICGHQQLGRVEDCQKNAFEAWSQEFRGDLGIALSDTVGFMNFLNDFDLYFSKLFDGARHDSGDPFVWGERLISHYYRFNIDPKTKQAVFSDGLTIPLSLRLYQHFSDRIKVGFGIGTNLTNDIEGFIAPQIVFKMIRCNGSPVAKISDSTGKGMCPDKDFEKYITSKFPMKMEG